MGSEERENLISIIESATPLMGCAMFYLLGIIFL
jgi:hypothetical protein